MRKILTTRVVVALLVIACLNLTGITTPEAAAQFAPTGSGDVNCDGLRNVGDALSIAQYAVGARSDGGNCPLANLAFQLNAAEADVNGDGNVSVGDALLVAQCAVGIPNDACPPPALALRGVNIAGAEFGFEGEIGEMGREYIYPTSDEIDFFIDEGMNVIRLPFRWERLQRSLYSNFNAAEVAELDRVVARVTSQGASLVLDPHNFGEYAGSLLGSSSVPSASFADLWSRLATRYQDNDLVIFALMNEPVELSQQTWISSANQAIAAIRATGATNLILVSGNNYTGAWSWFIERNNDLSNAEAILGIVDPADNVAVEVHQYLDIDSSGKSPICVSPTIGSERLESFTEWLRDTGVQGFLGEFGSSDNATCLAALDDMLDHIDDNDDVWLGWTYWAAGAYWPSDDPFAVEPDDGVSDDPQFDVLIDHLN